MKTFFIIVLAVSVSILEGGTVGLAADGPAGKEKSVEICYVATIQPLADIVGRMVGNRGRVKTLLSAAASPHTFAPTPTVIRTTEEAIGLFYVGKGLDRQWALKLPARHKIEMLELLPAEFQLPAIGHDHPHNRHDEKEPDAEIDPHFWTDPLAVRAMLPSLLERLIFLDSAGAETYRTNSIRFATELSELDRELQTTLRPLRQHPLFLFHPSFQYFFNRYNLLLAGVVEPFAGREPTPKKLKNLVETMKRLQINAIFTEPQLSRRPVEVLAEAASEKPRAISVYELDPLGGNKDRSSLEQLLRYNAATLLRALP